MEKIKKSAPLLHHNGVSYVLPFILITSCFALWGFANDITNPMVKAFSKIFRMSVTEGALVQVAFYGGYFAMAFPAAIFMRSYSSSLRANSACGSATSSPVSTLVTGSIIWLLICMRCAAITR